jgi:DNA-binding GntR family transcriptional regulator
MDVLSKARSPIDTAAQELRDITLGAEEGTFIGSEDDLVQRLKVSRVTVRQAARLLEREGVLLVRRGINGGYFASRPSVQMVETVVSAYLNTLGLDTRHTGGVATALWMETLRQAAGADRGKAKEVTARLAKVLDRVSSDADMREIGTLEQEIREAIFDLINGAYIRVFFGINTAFSRQQVEAEMANMPVVAVSREGFVDRWKKAKAMELEAIAEGDEMLAMMTALHSRKVWLSRGNADSRSATGASTEDAAVKAKP